MINSRIFSKEEIQFILDNYKGIGNQELCDRLNEKFKTNHSLNRVKGFKSNHKLNSGLTGRFKKGHTTFNKGLKQTDFMSDEAIERTKKTRFKKGLKSHNKKPLGSERICTKDGYIIVKVGEPDVWKHKHRVVWEEHHGDIPNGHIIAFLDGDKANFDIGNLKLVSREANAIVNKHIKLSDDAELNKAIYNLAELVVKTNSNRTHTPARVVYPTRPLERENYTRRRQAQGTTTHILQKRTKIIPNKSHRRRSDVYLQEC